MRRRWLRSGLPALVLLALGCALFFPGRSVPAVREGDGRTEVRPGRRLKSGGAPRTRGEARQATQRDARRVVRERRARMLTPGQRRKIEQLRAARTVLEANARETSMRPDDRAFLDLLEQAEQAGDIDFVSDAAQAALKSGNAELRRAVVESLATFGEGGIPELADYLADPDPEIAALAVDRYEMALQEVEDESEVATFAKLALLTLKDGPQIELMLSQVEMVSDELVAVQTMVDLIDEGGEEVASAVRELYERYTGDEWSDVDAAESWLRENYVPEAASPGDDADDVEAP